MGNKEGKELSLVAPYKHAHRTMPYRSEKFEQAPVRLSLSH